MTKRYFTLDEAQIIIEEVKKIMKELLEVKSYLDLITSIKIEYFEDYSGQYNEVNFTKINKEFHKLSYEFFTKIEKLEEKGCILKDLNEGLIDFYSLFEGKEIFLCWKYGEAKIAYWHDIDSGFTGRKPVSNLINK